MKNYYLLINLFILITMNGQSYLDLVVDYNFENGVFSERGSLIVKKDSTVFIVNELNIENNGKIAHLDESNNNITVKQQEINIAKRLFFSKLGSSVYNEYIPKLNFIVVDSIPKIEWKIISDETKKIGKFNATKAIANFRGTKIISYFTYDIPIDAGPWKFFGLPGLILEVYSVDDKIRWSVIGISSNIESKLNYSMPKMNQISQKEFIKISEREIKEQIQKIKARAPEGVKVKSQEFIRIGFEKVYEWEEN